MGMKRALTMAYHPQADSQTEIMNQTQGISLQAYVGPNRNNWVSSLNGLSLSYNSTPHTATGFTLAYLLRGYVPVTSSSLIHSLENISRYLEASYSLTENDSLCLDTSEMLEQFKLNGTRPGRHYYWDNIFRNKLIIRADSLMSLKKEF